MASILKWTFHVLLITSLIYYLPRTIQSFSAILGLLERIQLRTFAPCLAIGLALYLYVPLLFRRKPVKKPSLALQKQRNASYPPGYPNGWYVLADSKDVKRGQIIEVEALGRLFAVFRGENEGKVHIFDAYCPHMGANLARGGKVLGDCVQCPFHEWKFSGHDGECVNIPYLDKIPTGAKAKSYPTMEYHNMCLVYYDAEDREPEYFPDEVEEISSGKFVFRGEQDTYVDMHLIEFCENSADMQHFSVLHGRMTIPFTEWEIPGVTIHHEAAFTPDKHRVQFTDKVYLKIMGRDIPRSNADAIINLCGPGGTVYFRFCTEWGDVLLFHMHTPVEPLKQKVRFRWYADKSLPRLLVWYIVGSWISQVQSDRMVWENKRYLKRPMLVKNDGPLLKVRRWFNQFYSENSDPSRTLLDW